MSGPAGRHQAGGLVFDCDGVLADTTPCWEEAFSGVAAEFGLALRRDQLAALRGAALVTAARRMAGWSRRPVAAEEVLKALREQLVASIDAAELMLIEGVRQRRRSCRPSPGTCPLPGSGQRAAGFTHAAPTSPRSAGTG